MKDGIKTTEFWLQAFQTIIANGLALAVAINMIISGNVFDGTQAIVAIVVAVAALAASIKGQMTYTETRTFLKIESLKTK